jgi:mono/diheme cytochrome c family protein
MPVSKKRKKSTDQPSQEDSSPAPKATIHRSTVTTIVGIAVALGFVGWLVFGGGPEDATIKVIVPELSAKAKKGEESFNRVCIKCHGKNAGGSKSGPPLVDPFYKPGHHSDESIRSAILRGVRQHHWKFGPMAPAPGIKAAEIPAIITYVREIQKANGIF